MLIFVLPLDFHGRLQVTRTMFIPGALHGVEASFLEDASVRKLRTAVCRVVWSSRQPLASAGAMLSLLDGPTGCDPAFCIVWFRFRMLRWYLAYRPEEVPRVYRMIGSAAEGCPGHGLRTCFLKALLRLGFIGVLMCLAGSGLVSLFLAT